MVRFMVPGRNRQRRASRPPRERPPVQHGLKHRPKQRSDITVGSVALLSRSVNRSNWREDRSSVQGRFAPPATRGPRRSSNHVEAGRNGEGVLTHNCLSCLCGNRDQVEAGYRQARGKRPLRVERTARAASCAPPPASPHRRPLAFHSFCRCRTEPTRPPFRNVAAARSHIDDRSMRRFSSRVFDRLLADDGCSLRWPPPPGRLRCSPVSPARGRSGRSPALVSRSRARYCAESSIHAACLGAAGRCDPPSYRQAPS